MNNTAPTSPSGHAQQPTRDEQGRRARLLGVLKTVTVIAALLGLGTLNVLTLVNEEAHNMSAPA